MAGELVGEGLFVNIDERLIDLVLPRIIMDYGGQAILTKAFVVVEQCDRALCQHDVIDLVTLLVDSSKFWKILIMTVGLAEAETTKPYIVGLLDSRAKLRRIALRSKNMAIPRIIQSGSQLFPLAI